jgi:hypothetical protein
VTDFVCARNVSFGCRPRLLECSGLALVVVVTTLVALFVEEGFSPFAQLQARYNPPMISAASGAAMILLLKFRLSDR